MFETKDIVTAVYLRHRGHYCIGTVPANNPHKPQERLWLFDQTPELLTALEEVQGQDPLVPIREVFRHSTMLKNLLNDKDE